MCPACFAATATILASTASVGGLTALIATVVYRKKLSTAAVRPIQTQEKEN